MISYITIKFHLYPFSSFSLKVEHTSIYASTSYFHIYNTSDARAASPALLIRLVGILKVLVAYHVLNLRFCFLLL